MVAVKLKVQWMFMCKWGVALTSTSRMEGASQGRMKVKGK
jgi:hypothetical protein